MLKDSGTTREFDTGAHRDASINKGRCDLLPLKQVAMVMEDDILFHLGEFQENFEPYHIREALKIASKMKEWGGEANMMLEVAFLYEDGANKYGCNNWKKGMPLHCYIDSGVRHYLKVLRGDNDEPHYRGFVWNMLGALWTIENIPNALEEFENM